MSGALLTRRSVSSNLTSGVTSLFGPVRRLRGHESIRDHVHVGRRGVRGLAAPAARAEAPAPVVVMAHGLSGTRRDRLGPFAERFAAAGVAALVFDHRGFGDSGGEPDLFEPARQLEDWRAAIAFARSLAGVDPGASPPSAPRWAAATRSPPRRATRASPPRSARSRSSTSCARPIAPRPGSPRGCCAPRSRGGHLPAVGQPRRGGLHQRARRRGRLAPRRRDRRGLALAQPRLLALAARPSLPARSATRRAALPVARLRRRGRPGRAARGRRSPRRAGRRRASCAHTPASITSTSTTDPPTRRSSPTSSTSCSGTCRRPEETSLPFAGICWMCPERDADQPACAMLGACPGMH